MTETSFKITTTDEQLTLLQKKLALTVLPDELEDSGRDYGAPLADIKRLVARWRDGFDWRAQEAAINDELPQFTRDIDVEGHGTLNIHYVHMKSGQAGAIPLCFIHGWPGSFIEARKLAPLLVGGANGQPSFHVVALSLPGYGFSQQPRKKGFGLAQYAETAHKLMLALGYTTYVAQGGDWGAMITQTMSRAYGEKHVKAWHTNMPIGQPDAEEKDLSISSYEPEEQIMIKNAEHWRKQESAYLHIQRTKPQTLGYGISDSPVGLLAWIHEKLVSWSDNYPWTDDEVLTWVSIYWFSRAGPTASLRIYYEVFNKGQEDTRPPSKASPIPLGFSIFPGEIMGSPKLWRDRLGNVVFEEKHEKGGHFAAYEVPELLAGDLHKMFGKDGPAYGAVEGSDGYSG
ncbi:Alpha/Beta hydrolase protein [Schizophyllum amplum]|uniref:Alpha/Beta hydrolase protein n=1 Tax=Schizophyllum amplum TaxID=97359 RepID=A0A550BXI1_9AGAR|nr:Alpha/Beta hydrolase protein [Auriculariopsis ampla]